MKSLKFILTLSMVISMLASKTIGQGNQVTTTSNGPEFTANLGQLKDDGGNQRPDILYYGSSNDADLYFMKDRISYVFNRKNPQDSEKVDLLRMDMKYLNPNSQTTIQGLELTSGFKNFYLAHIPNGVTSVHSYKQILYSEIYHKTDLKISHNEKGIKAEFILSPGSNPDNIKFVYETADNIEITKEGKLKVTHPLGVLEFDPPSAYQKEGEFNKPVNVTFVKNGSEISINILNYKSGKMIVLKLSAGPPCPPACKIPPITPSCPPPCAPAEATPYRALIPYWATYYGGTASEENGNGVHIDNNQNIYITGYATAQDFPFTQNAFQTTFLALTTNAILIKFDKDRIRKWATFYGGSVADIGSSVVTGFGNSDDILFFVGQTLSSNFPIKQPDGSGFYQDVNNGYLGDGFIVKLTAQDGIWPTTKHWTTYFGGGNTDRIFKIAIDQQHNEIYILGISQYYSGGTNSNFPVKNFPGAYFQSEPYGANYYSAGFIAKFNSSFELINSTFLGGPDFYPKDLAIDKSGNVFCTSVTKMQGVSGCTPVLNYLPLCTPAGAYVQYNVSYGSIYDEGFIWKFNNNGVTTWSTFIGGYDNDNPSSIALDNYGNIFLTGTTSSIDFPVKNWDGALNIRQRPFTTSIFINKFDVSCSLEWSTYFNGRGSPYSMILDNSHNLYIVGYTSNYPVFPIKNKPKYYKQTQYGGGYYDGFILMFNKKGEYEWSTLYGGDGTDYIYNISASSLNNEIVLTGNTESNNFPTFDISNSSLDYYDGSYNGSGDIFIVNLKETCFLCEQERRAAPEKYSLFDNEKDKIIEIKLFPNPSLGKFYISLENKEIDADLFLEIYNSLGQKVYSKKIDKTAELNAIPITIPDIKPGIFWLSIRGKNDLPEEIKKIVVY